MAGGKYRSFLVHMKAVCDRSMEESARPVLRMPSSRPQGNKAHSLSNLLQRAQAPKVQYHLLTLILHICPYERDNQVCMMLLSVGKGPRWKDGQSGFFEEGRKPAGL